MQRSQGINLAKNEIISLEDGVSNKTKSTQQVS